MVHRHWTTDATDGYRIHDRVRDSVSLTGLFQFSPFATLILLLCQCLQVNFWYLQLHVYCLALIVDI